MANLAVIAINSQGLDPQLPALEIDLRYFFDGGVFGHIDGFANGPGNKGLHSGHHANVTHGGYGSRTHGRIEYGVVLGLETRRINYMSVLTDELNYRFDCFLGVSQFPEGTGDCLVNNLHRTTANELLELDQGEVRLNAGCVAVHHEPNSSRGS